MPEKAQDLWSSFFKSNMSSLSIPSQLPSDSRVIQNPYVWVFFMSSAAFTLSFLSLGPATTAASLGNPKQFRHSGNTGELSGSYFLPLPHQHHPEWLVDIVLEHVMTWPTAKTHKCSKYQSVPVTQQLSDQSICTGCRAPAFHFFFLLWILYAKAYDLCEESMGLIFALQPFHVVWDNRLFRGPEIVKSQFWGKINLYLASNL